MNVWGCCCGEERGRTRKRKRKRKHGRKIKMVWLGNEHTDTDASQAYIDTD